MQNPGVIPLFSSTLWLALTQPLLSNGFREKPSFICWPQFSTLGAFKGPKTYSYVNTFAYRHKEGGGGDKGFWDCH